MFFTETAVATLAYIFSGNRIGIRSISVVISSCMLVCMNRQRTWSAVLQIKIGVNLFVGSCCW